MNLLEQFYSDYKKLFELALYDNRTKKYKRKYISKKSGGKRRLLIPPKTTDELQKKLNKILQTIYNEQLKGDNNLFNKTKKEIIKNLV